MRYHRTAWLVAGCLAVGFSACKDDAPTQPSRTSPEEANNTRTQTTTQDSAQTTTAPLAVDKAAEQNTPSKAAELSTKTPLDFGATWKQIVETADPGEQSKLSRAFAATWTGKRYRWTGAIAPGLCVDKKRMCVVNVFPRKSDPHLKWLGGFFPSVHMTEDAWATLHTDCKDARSCVVTFEGTLARATAEIDAPLLLDFRDASLHEVRPERPDEGWFAYKTRQVLGDKERAANKKKMRTGNPTVPPAALIQKQTF